MNELMGQAIRGCWTVNERLEAIRELLGQVLLDVSEAELDEEISLVCEAIDSVSELNLVITNKEIMEEEGGIC